MPCLAPHRLPMAHPDEVPAPARLFAARESGTTGCVSVSGGAVRQSPRGAGLVGVPAPRH